MTTKKFSKMRIMRMYVKWKTDILVYLLGLLGIAMIATVCITPGSGPSMASGTAIMPLSWTTFMTPTTTVWTSARISVSTRMVRTAM